MKVLLRAIAALLLLGGLVIWIAKGSHMGWSATSKAVEKIDPVTEINYREYVDGFYPGIDFLGGILVVSLVLFGGSFLARKKIEPK